MRMEEPPAGPPRGWTEGSRRDASVWPESVPSLASDDVIEVELVFY